MAAVFTISATTLATRLGVVPRWLAVLGYGTAVLLLGVGLVPWLQLAFPGWVFTLTSTSSSSHFAVTQRRSPRANAHDSRRVHDHGDR